MGYWGWRPLFICVFISVWVVGCNIVSDASPSSASPTPSPRVTLTIRRAESPTPTTTPKQAVPRETTLLPTGTPRASQPPDIPLDPPACYETPAGSLLCLGRVVNTLDDPLEQVALRVTLFRLDGTPLASEHVEIEQSLIPPQTFAPYRALFDVNIRDVSHVSASVQRAIIAHDAEQRFATLKVQGESVEMAAGRLLVTAELYNPGPDPADNIRLIVTLTDLLGNVTGYRVAQMNRTLPAGETMPVRVEIVPQVETTPEYTIYVEALRGQE